jgi:hypothetical protein
LRAALPSLKADLETLKSRGQDVSYPRVPFTVLENFVGYVEEDARRGEVRRAFEQLHDMEAMAARTRRELREALAGRRQFAAVPQWTGTQRPVVKSSSFLAPVRLADGTTVERPVFFTGYGHFGQVVADMEKWPNYGTNIIQIEFGPSSVLPKEGVVDDAPMRNMLRTLDRAQKAGVAVCLLISPHYFPEWALAKWPHLRKHREGFLQYCLHAPEGRELLHRFVTAAIAPLKDHPALHSICLSNEPVNQEEPCEPAKRSGRRGSKNGMPTLPRSTRSLAPAMPPLPRCRCPIRSAPALPRHCGWITSASTRSSLRIGTRCLPTRCTKWRRTCPCMPKP